MINQYSIENFKIHDSSEILELNGLTIFTGANNSGKTSMIQSIRALSKMRIYANKYIYMPLEQIEGLGSLKNTLNKAVDRKADIRYSFVMEPEYFFISMTFGSALSLNGNDGLLKEDTAVLKSLEMTVLSNDGRSRTFVWTLEPDWENPFASYHLTEKDNETEKETELGSVLLTGFTLMSTIDIIKPEGVRKEVLKCLAGLSSLGSGKIRYLGPYRHIDTMAGGGNASGMLEEDGANMCNILSVFQDKVIFDGHTTLKQSFEYWTRKMLDSSFFIRQEGKRINLYTVEQDLELEITQIGFGNTQILPIILEILLAKKGDIVIIENPEVHLHPRWKADLMELFYFAAEHGIKVVIETQSVEMILRGRLLVRKNPEYKDLTALYSFEKDGFTCTISRIEIEDTGRLDSWPKDFIDRVIFEDTWRLL